MRESNYFVIHPNKQNRKVVSLGKFLSPERKKNLALKMYAAMSYDLHQGIEYMEIFTKGFRKDNLIGVIGDVATLPNGDTTIIGGLIEDELRDFKDLSNEEIEKMYAMDESRKKR